MDFKPSTDLGYTSAIVTCEKLLKLRTEASALKNQILEQQAKLRSARSNNRRSGPRSTSDLALFLQRKLARTAAKIEVHISEHHCQN